MPDSTDTATETTAPAGDQTPPTFEPITSQEALDQIVQKRLAREAAKREPLEAEVGQLRQQLEQAGAATQELEQARARVAELEGKTLRTDVATEKGVPAALLTGDTREALEASADALLEFRGQTPQLPTGSYVPIEGRQNTDTPVDPKRELVRQLFKGDTE